MNESEKDNEAVELLRDSEPWPSPGRKLKELREARGMTQSQVGEALHLTLHYINALEADLYQKLPGKTFAKGYLKSYAVLLGADVDDIVARFEKLYETREESTVASGPQAAQGRRAGDQHKRWTIAAGVLLLAILGVAWWSGQNEGASGNQARGIAAQNRVEAPAAQPVRGPRANSAEALISRAQAPRSPAPEPLPAQAEGTAAGIAPAGTELAGLSDGQAPGGDAGVAPGPEGALAGAEQAGITAEAPAAPVAGESAEEQAPADGGAVLLAGAVQRDDALEAVREEATAPAGDRIISLDTGGDDLLVLHLSGTSWVEVDNGDNVRLYNDNLDEGDELTIRGEAPFSILLGNAAMVELEFNSRAVDVAASTRRDNTARLVLEP